jgi:general secretion pathway protein A
MRDTSGDLTLTGGDGRVQFFTYEPYYGLKEKPFSLASDPRFLYKSPVHTSVYDDILDAIRRREGVVVLTGDIGTGKTTLCRSVLKDLDRKTFSTFVPDPFLSREDLLKMLLIEFGVMSVDDLKSGRLAGASRPDLSYPLYDFLKSLVPLQAFAVLVIDEAQNLPMPLLEEIRILSDLEGPEKLLQVVLIGQPELLPKLKDPLMRQLDQRVSVRCTLEPLDRDSISGYIDYRIKVAGGGSDRVTFSGEAIDAIYRGTNGNPRLINLVCDRSLYRGHLARTFNIGPDIVRQALGELGIAKLTPAPEPATDFGLDNVLETAAPPAPEPRRLLDVGSEEAAPARFGAFKWIATGLLGLSLGALLLFGWQLRQTLGEEVVTPTLPVAPARAVIHAAAPPVAPVTQGAASASDGGLFEVGVALFSGRTRASRLEVALAVAGYQASTRAVDFARGRMYEVRTGPYATRAGAETDAARIRRMPGYADARVIPPPAKLQ